MIWNKFKEWWEDHIAWYYRNRIKHPIKRFFEVLGIWFSYLKICRKVYDFDFTGILEVERHQIERTRDAITHFQSHVNWERDVRHMNLTLKLLSIAMEEDDSYERVSGDSWFEEDPKNPNLCIWESNIVYKSTKYINTRNSKRFSKADYDKYPEDSRPLFLDSLRVQKAWYLYNKLKYYWEKSWWD